jgi:hypothetical protein
MMDLFNPGLKQPCAGISQRLGFAQKVPYAGKITRAKAQRRKALPRFERTFFAPLRLCARKTFLPTQIRRGFEYFCAKHNAFGVFFLNSIDDYDR